MAADAGTCLPRRRVGIVVKGWPRLSETFIAQELVGLERHGLDLAVFSLRHPTDAKVHALARELQAPVSYLPEYLHDEPLRVLGAASRIGRWPGWRKAAGAWLRDLVRDPTRSRVRRFGQALVLARELPDDIDRLHAHFLHTPASVARYTALLRALPWSVSAHAKDIWTTPDWDLREKLAEARWTVTCTAAGRSRLAALARHPGSVELVRHGLDFSRFPAVAPEASRRDGTAAGGTVHLLSVGRAVAKKGFDITLRALAMLPAGLDWRWTHVGGGG
ncbi:MAG TPA: colanic acid biosynthesis glycosyltransferase WcaL, partial [Arenibaculum sp.]|nr:colanic acid biosynthesis glycosyltransferase WcaL [Arenibaculum sp.]